MNDQRLEKNVRENAAKVRKDVTTLVENHVSQFSKDVDRLTGEAKKTMVNTAKAVKKDVGHRLNQYNAKAQKVADKVPDSFAKTAAKYSWVAISIALAVALVVGIVLRPSRLTVGEPQI